MAVTDEEKRRERARHDRNRAPRWRAFRWYRHGIEVDRGLTEAEAFRLVTRTRGELPRGSDGSMCEHVEIDRED